MLELLPEVTRGVIMNREQEEVGLDTEEIAGLSKDEALQRIRKMEHQISTLEWDSKMNQIHPYRLYQLKRLKEECKLLSEHCVAFVAEVSHL